VNPTVEACGACLRRSRLLAHLAPRITGLLGRRGRAPGLLALSDDDLLAAAAGSHHEWMRERMQSFSEGAERRALDDAGVLAVCRHSGSYPVSLGQLPDPPTTLFCLGRVGTLALLRDEPAVAVVGTRRPSPYGNEVAYGLGRGLGASGVTLVSGLALGIDATSHRGCLDGGGVPVAVLACGPERAYPLRHRTLHARVAAAGLVLSELPPGTGAHRWSFPARNRIMAGLSRMTVVVEAADPSGSLITAEFARELGRTVAAVPGRITASMAQGTNGLLRDGAVPVTGVADVLDELFGVGVRCAPATARAPGGSDLRAVLEAVEAGCGVDEIGTRAGLAASEVRVALGRLEAGGHIVRGGLGGWERRVM
jgi:DNA processing protein